MAKTVALNDAQTVWVTTYYGGRDRGTCFDVSVQLSGILQATATFTLNELAALVMAGGTTTILEKPSFD